MKMTLALAVMLQTFTVSALADPWAIPSKFRGKEVLRVEVTGLQVRHQGSIVFVRSDQMTAEERKTFNVVEPEVVQRIEEGRAKAAVEEARQAAEPVKQKTAEELGREKQEAEEQQQAAEARRLAIAEGMRYQRQPGAEEWEERQKQLKEQYAEEARQQQLAKLEAIRQAREEMVAQQVARDEARRMMEERQVREEERHIRMLEAQSAAQIAEEMRQIRIQMQLEAARRRGEAIAIYR
ncbi:hypothetical protein [Roseimicrobium sp. ORNL1]|uniref:hypothetical protein n=1 Tax=Roseimicrobium sp. ORNL1 TaxID=2711231 RepID=UPI0013E169CF|nr:hypothetical protein [Roseimicrobium sp. ORNL1]QIF02428.1 hypothetical protein G5S37_13140 [Roseimicrobium sp. ORNL1]